MLLYIVDGFNLIHKIPEIKQSGSPRRDLVNYIKRAGLTGSKNNKVIIIFDGYRTDELDNEQSFEIVFSGVRTADEVIKARIDKITNKAQIIVVTDDREIRDYARSSRVKSLHNIEFINPKKFKPKLANDKSSDKDISYVLQKEITDQMRKIWLKE